MGDCSGGAALLLSGPDGSRRRIFYFYEPTIGYYEYGPEHPMRLARIRMAHKLIAKYNLRRHFQTVRPSPATARKICGFHAKYYVDFLSTISPQSMQRNDYSRKRRRFNLEGHCPVFDGIFEFCQASAAGSIDAAATLNRGNADISINWAGGFHHPKRREAAGFCYVNDIVLGILKLLKVHKRVLYVDIDLHHGDGVEEAFYATDRVMTVSLHRHGDGFFPAGTGNIFDIGSGPGEYYSLNVPLLDGMDDDSYNTLFRAIIQRVMEVYQPDAVVLQCGADSLSGDMLGTFNLSVKGHGDSLRFLRSFNVPLWSSEAEDIQLRMLLDRCWCYETAIAVGVEPDNDLPYNDYYDSYGPDYTLHVKPPHMVNRNTRRVLGLKRTVLLEQLAGLPHAPSVPFQTTPSTSQVPEEKEEED